MVHSPRNGRGKKAAVVVVNGSPPFTSTQVTAEEVEGKSGSKPGGDLPKAPGSPTTSSQGRKERSRPQKAHLWIPPNNQRPTYKLRHEPPEPPSNRNRRNTKGHALPSHIRANIQQVHEHPGIPKRKREGPDTSIETTGPCGVGVKKGPNPGATVWNRRRPPPLPNPPFVSRAILTREILLLPWELSDSPGIQHFNPITTRRGRVLCSQERSVLTPLVEKDERTKAHPSFGMEAGLPFRLVRFSGPPSPRLQTDSSTLYASISFTRICEPSAQEAAPSQRV